MVVVGTYRHFKGKNYKVVMIAKHSETLEDYVVYQALYGEKGMWVRPLAMFEETVKIDGDIVKRFEYIGE
jgi:cyclomaltodextrinase